MKAKLIIFPSENGFNVAIWGAWMEGSMRVRSFENRTEMIALLESLRLLGPGVGRELEKFTFLDSCPLYSAEVDEEMLETHGFRKA
jgi:hypothetical protein